jgi:hypothetical protein
MRRHFPILHTCLAKPVESVALGREGGEARAAIAAMQARLEAGGHVRATELLAEVAEM